MAKKAGNAKQALAAANALEAANAKTPIWVYFASFFIPVILTFIAYAAFGIYPFGDRSVLALDLNGQYVYYFEALRDAFWGDGSIFYNWSRNLSGEFMGIIGYYLASPFTLIVMLLPRTMLLESLLIMQLAKLGSAGLTFLIYARKSKKVKPLQSLLFSTMYSMMGYAVIQLIDPMWIDGVVFLPLIVLGIEYLIDDGRKINYIIPLAIMFVANFYIGFMVAIFVAIYFFFYLFFGTERKFKTSYDYLKVVGRMGLATAIVLMCSAIMILPVYNALSLGKFEFSGTPDYSYKAQFSPIELVPTLLPNQYYSVNMQGLPEIYCGVLSAVLLPLFYLNNKVKKNTKIGYSLVIFLMVMSMYVKPIDMMWHGGQTPNWLPYRYSFILAFVLVSIAAEVFSKLDGYKLTFKTTALTFAGITGLILIFKGMMSTFEYSQAKYKYVAVWPYTTTETQDGMQYTEMWLGTIAFGIMLAAFYLVMLWLYSNASKQKTRTLFTCGMAAVVLFEAGYNCYDSFKKVHKEVYFSARDTYYDKMQGGRDIVDMLEEYDDGFYRSEKTTFRSANDNLCYGLRGVSHSSSVMNTKIINFLETMGYSMRSYVTSYEGNTSLSDSLLGIKYVLHEPTNTGRDHLLNPDYTKVLSHDFHDADNDKQTYLEIYQNPDALSIGYMVSKDITRLSHLGNDNPFNSQNMFLGTMTGNTKFTTTDAGTTIDGTNEYFYRIPEEIVLSECYESPYGEQRLFTANADATDPVINIHITAQSDDEIYMYLKSLNEKGVNTWISTKKDENGNFIEHESLGTGSYYENHDYSMLRVGSFPAGTEIEIRLTIRLNAANPDKDEYTIIKNFFIYHFNDDLFHQDLAKLADNQWNITEYNDRYLKGTITAEEGQMMFTSIPSEPGWSVKVDGKKVETVEILKSFIGIELEPGEHTIEMKYTPPGFVLGVITLILGIGAIIVLYMYDRKNNAVLIARIRAKKRAAEGLPAETAEKKNVAIIKSKGSVADIPVTEAEEKIEQAADNKPPQPQQQNKNKNKGKKKKKKR